MAAISTLYFFIVNIPKLAILALFYRLFPETRTYVAIYVLAAILIGASMANTIAALAACQPYAANWNPALAGAHCIDKEALFRWSSMPNIVTDVAMLILPLPIIWHLQTNKRMKAGLTITFLVGSFGLVTSVLRFTSFFTNNSFTDGTYAAVELISWTEVEPGVYLISACLLTYRPLLDRISFRRVADAVTGRSSKNSSASGSRFGKRLEASSTDPEMGIGLQSRAEGAAFHRLDDSQSSRDESLLADGIVKRTDVKVESEPGRSRN